MLDVTKLSKLTVGDIADYERWRREERKKELISITKELYGDKIPPDSLNQIEQELRRIPTIMDDNGFDITAAQYLFWRSMQKTDKDVTMAQVGSWLEADNLEEYSTLLFPANLPEQQKKTMRPIKRKRSPNR